MTDNETTAALLPGKGANLWVPEHVEPTTHRGRSRTACAAQYHQLIFWFKSQDAKKKESWRVLVLKEIRALRAARSAEKRSTDVSFQYSVLVAAEVSSK